MTRASGSVPGRKKFCESMNQTRTEHFLWERSPRGLCTARLMRVAALALMVCAMSCVKGSSLPQQNGSSIEGAVRNAAGEMVSGATVTIVLSGSSNRWQATTKEDGAFSFSGIGAGVYSVSAEKADVGKAVVESLVVGAGEKKRIELALKRNAKPDSGMEFNDTPSFTVAGVTDWSNAGLHGSGSEVRTSETLARETVLLKAGAAPGVATPAATKEEEDKLRAEVARAPRSFEANHKLGELYCRERKYARAIPLLETAEMLDPGNLENTYELGLAYGALKDWEKARQQIGKLLARKNSGDGHRMAGGIYERLGDPTDAVQEFEQAAHLEASEENYFAWGSEFLTHQGTEPAVEIFGKGARLHPDSARMLTGLGAAQYGTRAYEDAAKTLCKAADLKPQDATAYIFLGKIEKASTEAFPCSDQKLARFAHEQPENALANYYYGVILWKRAKAADDAEKMRQAARLIEKCIALDPKMDEAYLQMGVMDAERKEFARAAEAYKKAIEINPKAGEAHYRLGQVYKRLGDDSNAQKELQTYKQIEKDEEAEREKEARGQLQLLVRPKETPTEAKPQ
jgi:tetratricopeptide (TPR) repeat protein